MTGRPSRSDPEGGREGGREGRREGGRGGGREGGREGGEGGREYMYCFAVCLTSLASFFLPSSSLINKYIHVHVELSLLT